MKIIIAPDKFKGSLDSFEVCRAINNGVLQVNKKWKILPFPMADGGDGFARVMQHYFNTAEVSCATHDPLGKSIEALYLWSDKTRTAIIELTTSSGLLLLKKEEQNPLYTSTYGTGLQIKDAIVRGAKKILLGIGGSATNDAGTGILSALGFQFLDRNGILLKPCGKNLALIERIVPPVSIPRIKIDIVCDVQNILHGINGAAFIYAPQKGASADEVIQLDEGLKHFASILYKETGKNVSQVPGTGAAGGIAAGLMGYFDVSLIEGAKMITEKSGIEKELMGADLLITGEGKIDDQSKEGKVVGRIAALGKKYNVPVIAYCGVSDIDSEEAAKLGLTAVFAISDEKSDTEYSIKNAAALLVKKVAATLPSIMA